MGRDSGRLREEMTTLTSAVKKVLLQAGAAAAGVAQAAPVEARATDMFDRWLASGHESGMSFMRDHAEIRKDPRLLLEGARSVISIAFGYGRTGGRDPRLPRISAYALLPDYHDWIRKLIRRSGIGELLGEEHTEWRICVDSAPIMERYWAVKSGIGIRGDNGSVIIPGVGCEVFLAEIVTTHELACDNENQADCGHCGACRRACPTGALRADGTADCERCISYLTIEHRGEWTTETQKEAMATAAGRTTLFGCDRCVTTCPHNTRKEHDRWPPLKERILTLTGNDILEATQEELSALLQGSCLKRAKREGLARNASNLGTV